jgi:putative chitinase
LYLAFIVYYCLIALLYHVLSIQLTENEENQSRPIRTGLQTQFFGEDYEGREDLGNTQPGDGVRFKGRGLMQLTGRANYAEFSKDMNQDFIAQPQLVGQIPWAIWVAGWYWHTRHLNKYADRDDLEQVTCGVNGGYNDLEDRRRYLEKAKSVLGA